MDILQKILKNATQKNKEINKILNTKINYKITFNNEQLSINDDNNNKIIVSDYIFFGIYQPKTHIWIWAHSIPGVSNKQITILKDIKKKSYLFENYSHTDIQFIYQFLNNDMIEINNIAQLELINDVLLYLTDAIYILNPINKYNNIQYIGITHIIEKYK